jgi:serine/threonine protein phosphatase PrpC
MEWLLLGASDVGLVRDNNEDSAFVSSFCLVVADGVGGHAAGEVASATAAYAVTATVLRHLGEEPARSLTAGFALAQAQVHAGATDDLARNGMATTLTAVATDGTRFVLGHLGDSRCYVYRRGGLTRVTKDHTYVQRMLDEGRVQPAEAADHPFRNVVLRSVGAGLDGTPDLLELNLASGDRLLLSSDGLTDLVTEAEIAGVLHAHADKRAVRLLVEQALARGGNDNITCVVATVVEGAALVPDGELYGSMRDPRNVVDLAAVHARSA